MGQINVLELSFLLVVHLWQYLSFQDRYCLDVQACDDVVFMTKVPVLFYHTKDFDKNLGNPLELRAEYDESIPVDLSLPPELSCAPLYCKVLSLSSTELLNSTFLALFHLAIARGLNNKNIEDLVSGWCMYNHQLSFRSREVGFYGVENCEYSLQLAG